MQLLREDHSSVRDRESVIVDALSAVLDCSASGSLFCKSSCTAVSLQALMLRRFCGFCLRIGGRIDHWSLDTTSLWSVQHSASLMARVSRTSEMSQALTITKSIRCQCFDLGCIHVAFLWFCCWNSILVMTSPNSEHKFRRRIPLLLAFPRPCLLTTPAQTLWFVPTLALKSPRITNLSLGGRVARRQL